MVTYKLNDNIFLYHSFDNESYLVNLDTNDSFGLNQTSLMICSLLNNEWISIAQIVDKVYEIYNTLVEKAILQKDIECFIQDMSENAFVISRKP